MYNTGELRLPIYAYQKGMHYTDDYLATSLIHKLPENGCYSNAGFSISPL